MTRGRGTFESHAALSLGAALVAAVVTFVTLPYIVNRLGFAQYGLFSLLALTTAYVGVLDLGFSWTTSRYLADALERADERLAVEVLRVSLSLYVTLGVFGAAGLVLAARPLVESVFNVPERLTEEGVDAARVFALAFPSAMLQIYAASVLRGARRFDLGAAVQVTTAVVTAGSVVVTLAVGGGLVHAAAALAVAQTALAAVALAAANSAVPGALRLGRVNSALMRTLGRFSLNVMISNLGGQALYLTGRLAIGVLLPLRAVTQFSVPLALAQRLQIVPAAFVSAALPTLTASVARRDEIEFWRTLSRVVGGTVILLVPPLVLAVLWAPALLDVWFSDEFSSEAAWALRVVLVAILLNAVSAVGTVACDAAGVPGIPAAATLIASGVHIPLTFALTHTFGIVGAAAALAFSFVIVIVLIALRWDDAAILRLHRPRVSALIGRRGATLATGLAAWAVGVEVLERGVDSRVSLVFLSAIALGSAYVFVTVALGKRAIADWLTARAASTGQ